MRTLWPPSYDIFTARIWSLAIAFTFMMVLVLWLMSGVELPLFLGVFTIPGEYAGLWFSDFEFDRYTTTSWVVWYAVNFVCYFLIARFVIGVFKIIKDIRNA